MSILTKEVIQKILNDDWLLMDDCEGLENCTVIKELARMALAAMDSEPVAEVVSIYGDPEAFGEREIRPLVGIQQMPYGTKLYRHAQHPVVPDDVLDALQKVASIRLDLNDFDGDRRGIADCLGDAEEALIEIVNRRAAMLNHPSSIKTNTDAAPGTEIKHPSSNSPAIPEGYVMVPKEPTKEMIDAGWLHFMGTKNPSSKGTYKAMLAAAPQEVPDGK